MVLGGRTGGDWRAGGDAGARRRSTLRPGPCDGSRRYRESLGRDSGKSALTFRAAGQIPLDQVREGRGPPKARSFYLSRTVGALRADAIRRGAGRESLASAVEEAKDRVAAAE